MRESWEKMRDHYLVLGLAPTANEAMIRGAYERLSREYHPDYGTLPKEEAKQKLAELERAYETLTTRSSKQDYDASPIFKLRSPESVKNAYSETLRMGKVKLPEKKRNDLSWRTLLITLGVIKEVKRDPVKANRSMVIALSLGKQAESCQECKSLLLQAAEADPQLFEAHYDLAVICYRLGEYDEARRHLQDALKLRPEDKLSKKFLSLLA